MSARADLPARRPFQRDSQAESLDAVNARILRILLPRGISGCRSRTLWPRACRQSQSSYRRERARIFCLKPQRVLHAAAPAPHDNGSYKRIGIEILRLNNLFDFFCGAFGKCYRHSVCLCTSSTLKFSGGAQRPPPPVRALPALGSRLTRIR